VCSLIAYIPTEEKGGGEGKRGGKEEREEKERRGRKGEYLYNYI